MFVHLLTTATSTDEDARKAAIAVLPVGSFEQHGDHLPLITDTVVACLIAQGIAETYDLRLLPPVTISCSHEHEGFAGTVSISASTVMTMINDIRTSLARSGVDRLVIVNGHGGNHVLTNVTQEANVSGPRVVLYPQANDWIAARTSAGLESTWSGDMHGGEIETSIMLHAYPDLVRDSYRTADHEARHRPELLVTGLRGYTDTGIIGSPSLATAAKGRAVLESLTALFADHLKVLDQ
ncbi:creatininase family protein [Kribbella sp. NPDC059898]|uniref:creatininase family protein n=1 Tax=Kribbella sp. NPDC059898 TaxID=3346995 RepID=UPI0036628CF9